MKKVYTEIGLGNTSFFSTEFEEGEKEYRVQKFIRPTKVYGYYVRIWLFKTVIIFSTNEGIKIRRKDSSKLKVLFGISGEME